nr:plasmid pRiA4b ORF-3 family protein [Candidatus Sigynarchaeota archaeon]
MGESKNIAKKNDDPHEQVLQLKITLKDIKPPVWRRVLIKDGDTFEQLHAAIQDSFGWADYHLHEFSFKSGSRRRDRTIICQDCEDVDVNHWDYKERSVQLRDFLPTETMKMQYTYDFGDNWEHLIVLERILPVDPAFDYPVCIKSKGECPEEDSGGPYGWMARNADGDDDEDEY